MSNRKYPQEMLEYVKSIAKGKSRKEIAQMTAQHFDIEFTEQRCKEFMSNHRIVSGVDGHFQPGHTPHNKGKKMSEETYEKVKHTFFKPGHKNKNEMPLGTIKHDSFGYVIKKVKMTGVGAKKWKYMHRIIWEEHYGPIPDGCYITFLDGNKDNLDINNLAMITTAENVYMNTKKLRGSAEITDTGIKIARLQNALYKKKQEEEQSEEGRSRPC